MDSRVQKGLIRDPLTGVYSRAMLNARLEEELERARRYDHPFTLLLLDLDHFKNINDAFGHHRGDLVLIEFARRIEAEVRGSDSVFRYGGDEFVILLPNTGKEKGVNTAQRLLEIIKNQPFTEEPPLSISMTVGLASYPEDGATAEGLFDIADKRHQSAKRMGRNRVIAERVKQASTSAVDPPSRLIERDMAQASVNQFLNLLPETNRSVLQIAGSSGSGRTRMLAEIRKIAHLRGYAVLSIQGTPSTKNRPWSALLAAEEYLPDLAFSLKDDSSGQQLAGYVHAKGQAGLIAVIDGLVNVDKSSLDYLRELFYAAEIPQIGLVFSDGESVSVRSFPFNISLQEIITLKPISPASLRIWLRQSLQWEAPHELITWLHRETGGYPRQIQRALETLYDQELLQKTESEWIYSDELVKTSLAHYLSEITESPPHNLPEIQVEIVNRSDELNDISELIQEHRLIVIHGPAGVGKTTLAIQAANGLLEQFPDGIFLIKLNTVASQAQLAGAVAAALGLPADDPKDRFTSLMRYLNEKSILLILDHYQPLLLSTKAVEDFIQETSHTHFFITSRNPLSITGEKKLEISGLEIPPPTWEPPLLKYDSCQLFLAVARRSAKETQINPENQRWIAQICRLVQGLPMAIELAGAWVQTLEYEEIAQRIARSQALSSSTETVSAGSGQIVEIVLEAFWELLSETDRNTLSQLTIFNGPFRREVAHKVTGASPFFLDALASKALLAKSTRGYFEIPDSLRSYLSVIFHSANVQFQQIQSRHAKVYGEYATQLAADLEGKNQRAAYLTFSDELENFLAAWNWGVSQAEPETIQQLLTGLGSFFHLDGSYMEARKLFVEAYDRLNHAAHQSDKLTLELEPVLGLLLVHIGKMEALLGNLAAGRKAAEEGLQFLLQSRKISEIAPALITLAEIIQDTDLALAETHLKESLRIFRQQSNPLGVWEALTVLGILTTRHKRFEIAQNAFEQARKILSKNNDEGRMARTLSHLGHLALHQGQLDKARDFLNKSMVLARDLEIPFLLGSVFDSLGKLECKSGHYPQSAAYLLQSLEIARQLHALPLARENLISIAELWGETGQNEAAVGLLGFVAKLPGVLDPERERLRHLESQVTAGLSAEQVQAAHHLYVDRSFFGVVEEILKSNIRV